MSRLFDVAPRTDLLVEASRVATAEPKPPKLSITIARQIEDQIAALNWPLGEVIASEAELLDQFGVSRSVLREAIRIVELTGAAQMRRGLGGGLTVTQPRRESVAMAAGVYFASMGVSVGEMQDAWHPLVEAGVQLAAENASIEDIRKTVDFMDEMAAHRRLGGEDFVDLQQRVTDLSGNSVLSLFVQALGDTGVSRLHGTRAKLDPPLTLDDALRHLRGYRRLVEAIAAHDPDEATERLHVLQQAVRDRMHDRPARPRTRPVLSEGRGKLGERVAHLMRDDIEREGWPEGELLGSESDLIERYDVSRAVLREALRILEFHGAIATRRGPGGGIFVAQPDSSAIVHSARVVIDFEGVDAAQIWDAREIVEDLCARLATERLDDEMAELIQTALADETEAEQWGVSEHVVHHAIACATRNRPLVLFVDALAELSTARVRAALSKRGSRTLPPTAEAHRAHQRIIAAIEDGDPDTAAGRMRRHVRAAGKSY